MKRNDFIDFLKGVCMLFIIVTHSSWTDQERLNLFFPYWIDMAVPILMIISGYVYSLSLRKMNSNCSLEILTPSYLIKKALRFTVPFVIAFVIEWAVLLLAGKQEFSILSLGVSFLIGGIGPGSYYYPIMMQFIFVAPLIYCVIKKYGKNGVIMCFIANLSYEVLQRAYDMNEGCYRLLLFRYIFLIAFGCFLALYKDDIKKKWYIIAFVVGAAFQAVTQYTTYEPIIIRYWTVTCCFSALYIIPVFVLLFEKVKPSFSIKPINAIGKASFNVFLVQMVYYSTAAGLVYKLVDSKPLQILINVVVCVIAGYIFYLIEAPITKAITGKCLGLVQKQ